MKVETHDASRLGKLRGDEKQRIVRFVLLRRKVTEELNALERKVDHALADLREVPKETFERIAQLRIQLGHMDQRLKRTIESKGGEQHE